MDYRKNITFYTENDEILYDFDIVLNRKLLVSALDKHPKYAKFFLNPKTSGIKRTEGMTEEQFVNAIVEAGKISELLNDTDIMSETLPEVVKFLFPKMLQLGEIRQGEIDEILSYVNEIAEDDGFCAAMQGFFTVVFTQRGEEKTKKKPKFKFN